MTKAKLIAKIYEKTELPSKVKAEEALNAILKPLPKALQVATLSL